MLRAEVAHLRGHSALVTSLTFSPDRSTLVTCAKDGKLAFWNSKDNYQLISMIKYSKTENELNAVAFMTGKDDASYLIVGGASGALSVFDINGSKVCFTQKSGFTPNEITKLFPLSK